MNKLMLSLSGFGYLENVWREDDGVAVSIKAITGFETSGYHDVVMLNCVLDSDRQAAFFRKLVPLIGTSNNIILYYKAYYEFFKVAHSGRAASDPQHLISLQARLLSVQRCYVNGELFKPGNQMVFGAH
jgi:hypothetical protein